jgi:hypothetical protein
MGNQEIHYPGTWRLSLREERFICLHVFDMPGLANQIESCLTTLRDARQTSTGNLYPIVSLSNGVSFGHSMP